MSISDLSLDNSADQSYDFSDRYSYSETPFTYWGYVQWLSPALNPSQCELRPIADKGALCDSIRNSNIDLFDRVPREESPLQKVARMVAIGASFLFTNLVLAPIGAVYHLAHGLKNAALIPFRSEERWELMKKTAQSLRFTAIDAVHGGIPLGVGIAVASTGLGLILVIAAVAITTLGIGFLSGEIRNVKERASESLSKEDQYGLYKAMRLREEFGIVNEKTGNFLSWDPQKDGDVTTFYVKSGLGYKLNGYFMDLRKERAEKFLNTVQDLQMALPSHCKIPFSYPPKAEAIVSFLTTAQTGLFNLEEWGKKLRAQEADMELIWDIISRGFTLSSKEVSVQHSGNYTETTTTTYTLPNQFPVTREACQKYFQH